MCWFQLSLIPISYRTLFTFKNCLKTMLLWEQLTKAELNLFLMVSPHRNTQMQQLMKQPGETTPAM